MKKFLVLIVFLFPLVSFSNCLEINGSFSCKTQDGNYQLDVTTQVVDGLYVYEIKEGSDDPETFYTDGMDRPFEINEDGMVLTGTMSSTCDANSLDINLNGKVEGMNGDLKVNLSYSLENGTLIQGGFVFFNGSIVEEISENCTLIKKNQG